MARPFALPPTLAPRLINREAAAAYVNVSPNTFDEMVKIGKMPSPKRLTARRFGYDVRALDLAVDSLPVGGHNRIRRDYGDFSVAGMTREGIFPTILEPSAKTPAAVVDESRKRPVGYIDRHDDAGHMRDRSMDPSNSVRGR